MRKVNAWKKSGHATLALCLLTVTALAFQNVYDKFRNRTYSNNGYLSEAEEIKLAEQVHQQLLNPPQEAQQQQQAKPIRLVRDSAVNDYVERLGQELARTSQRRNLPWRFYVVDDDSINAFATLGGRVYVHTGLIKQVQSEAQLASVIGHEVGHIVGRHGLENVKRAQRLGMFAVGATILGAIFGGQQGAEAGQALGGLVAGGFLMKHSREAEREADYLGLYNMQRSGYNTGGMVEMFGILAEISKNNAGSLGSIMASHPAPTERAENTRREITDRLRGSDQQGKHSSPEFQRIKSSVGGSTVTAPSGSNRSVRPRGTPTPRPRPRP
jgi:beta-barrel assembly-enhancing protease